MLNQMCDEWRLFLEHVLSEKKNKFSSILLLEITSYIIVNPVTLPSQPDSSCPTLIVAEAKNNVKDPCKFGTTKPGLRYHSPAALPSTRSVNTTSKFCLNILLLLLHSVLLVLDPR